MFKDLYTCFYYVVLFWYLFILTILRQPSELAISKDAIKQPLRLRNLLFANLNTIMLFYRKASPQIGRTFTEFYLKYGPRFPDFISAFRDMGNQLHLVKNQFNYVLGMDEFELNLTYLIWSCLRNTQDFNMYRATFKTKFEGKSLLHV